MRDPHHRRVACRALYARARAAAGTVRQVTRIGGEKTWKGGDGENTTVAVVVGNVAAAVAAGDVGGVDDGVDETGARKPSGTGTCSATHTIADSQTTT